MVLGGPPMPTLRRNNRSQPTRPPVLAWTTRSQTSASATAMAHPGSLHPRNAPNPKMPNALENLLLVGE
eukprot:11738-Lingulodinium_polyedra.AAC.1